MSTYFPRNNNKNGTVIIRRTNLDELNKAVDELKKRGYEEVKRGVDASSDLRNDFTRAEHLTANLGSTRKKELQASDTVKMFVAMKKSLV